MKLLWFFIPLILTSCADFQPEPFPESKTMKEGPGILTGPEGHWKVPILFS